MHRIYRFHNCLNFRQNRYFLPMKVLLYLNRNKVSHCEIVGLNI